jgi:nucleolar GTP-binding protein
LPPPGKTVTQLRRLPRVEAGEPVLVLVGMPNVGKSSLVTATSTGTPEINIYPFTTRSLKMGHVITPGHRYQLMDTPGVLRREEDERNAMEGLTLASVELLPSVVVFVMDLSGMSGPQSAPHLQLRVRDELRSQFPHRPWLDVRSKADLPLAEGIEPSMVPPGTLEVSVLEGTHVEELKERMTSLAVEEGQALADQEAMQEAAGQGQAQGHVEAPGPIVI